MKANEAPERIWIDSTNDLPKLNGHIDKDSIEYTRTDVFIRKTCEWIKEHSYDYLEFGEAGFGADFHYPKMIEDFKNYMKGE